MMPQYRELGALMWRGHTFENLSNQLASNEHDRAHGRQLPGHTGGRHTHVVYIKSTLGTHLPHAAGAAYAAKLNKEDRVTVAYFGDGSA